MQKLREGLSKLKTLTNLWIEFPEPGEKEDPVEISQTEFYKFIDCFKGLTKLKSISLLNLSTETHSVLLSPRSHWSQRRARML
mgnify:FL=1|jgi:hypothetical protein